MQTPPGTTPTKEPTREPGKEPIREPTKEPEKEPTKEPPGTEEEEETTTTPGVEEDTPTRRAPTKGVAISAVTGVASSTATKAVIKTPAALPKTSTKATSREVVAPPLLPRRASERISTRPTRATRHPRVVEWQQGVVNTRLDIDTGIRTHTKARVKAKNVKPKDTFQVVGYDNSPPVPKSYDMGIVRVEVTPQGVEFKRRAFPRKRSAL